MEYHLYTVANELKDFGDDYKSDMDKIKSCLKYLSILILPHSTYQQKANGIKNLEELLLDL